jgi:hypothetical protein
MQGKHDEIGNMHKKVHFEGFSRIPRIMEVNVTLSRQNDTGHYLDVDYRHCTKNLETVPNPDNFIGEPPHIEAQPSHAVIIYISNHHLFFPLKLFINYFYLFIYCSFFFNIVLFVFFSQSFGFLLLTAAAPSC